MGRKVAMAAVVLIPVTILFISGILMATERLDRRQSVFLVRSSLRSDLSPEETERIVSMGLARAVEAAELDRAGRRRSNAKAA